MFLQIESYVVKNETQKNTLLFLNRPFVWTGCLFNLGKFLFPIPTGLSDVFNQSLKQTEQHK